MFAGGGGGFNPTTLAPSLLSAHFESAAWNTRSEGSRVEAGGAGRLVLLRGSGLGSRVRFGDELPAFRLLRALSSFFLGGDTVSAEAPVLLVEVTCAFMSWWNV